jgi:putative FmdB family regulatory protein
MPTYEYTCRDCGHTFDIVQKMTDEPLTVCPECGGPLRKVFAVPAISFKGSGFYATDHGKKAKRPSETSEKADKKDTKKESAPTDGGGAKKEPKAPSTSAPKESAAS